MKAHLIAFAIFAGIAATYGIIAYIVSVPLLTALSTGDFVTAGKIIGIVFAARAAKNTIIYITED